jgi:hypothetical protein
MTEILTKKANSLYQYTPELHLPARLSSGLEIRSPISVVIRLQSIRAGPWLLRRFCDAGRGNAHTMANSDESDVISIEKAAQ